MKLTKFFEPTKIEKFWVKEWERRGYFTASTIQKNLSFSLHLPPPNVTGTLHMGHAFNQAIMDALTRYYRMRGFNTAWIPGLDHAGIATQIMVERELNTRKISRYDLGRTKFVETVLEWKKKFSCIITNQMRRMGVSVDWNREYFTMDSQTSKVVIEVFVRLYEEGLIYRGKRLVNWDPILGTAVSDLEVISNEEDNWMWYIRYPLIGSNNYITVATTRPETLLGDVAVAVHPSDERYIHLVGKLLKLPLNTREIPIIKDEYVDKTFGTGCVKITPAHDFNDYVVGQRHNLNKINIFTLDAKINTNGPIKYQGLDRFDARKQIISDLDKLGLLDKIIPYKSIISRSDRTGVIIEPMLTDQWFIAMNKPTVMRNNGFSNYFVGKSLAQIALEKVMNGEIKFIPKNWKDTYQQWLNNIQDWCISRQLWWGHQIPAWYDADGKIYVARNEEEAQKQAGGKNLMRDNDVLDTWFSSALIPFSTLGWPDKKIDYELFLPSSVLITGFDIIFFWVARMIMMTTYFTGKIPFKIVYVHGLVRDSHGQKMSKSKGNTLDPIDLIDGINLKSLINKRTMGLMNTQQQIINIENETRKEFSNDIPAYGVDALRFTLISLATLGRDINFDLHRCEGYRNFCNKLWNAARFVLINTENQDCGFNKNVSNDIKQNLQFSQADRWITSLLHRIEIQIEKNFVNYRLDKVASVIYRFVWDEYCCWYLEVAKIQLKIGNVVQQRATRYTLLQVLERLLRLAHPVLPFITETLWQAIAPLTDVLINLDGDSIMRQLYPLPQQKKIDEHAEIWMAKLKNLINTCRNLRSSMQLSSAIRIPLFIETSDQTWIKSFLLYLQVFAKLSTIQIVRKLPILPAPIAIIDNVKFMLEVKIDILAERERLMKEINRIKIEISKINITLSNSDFIIRAPSQIVMREKTRLANCNKNFKNLQEQLLKL